MYILFFIAVALLMVVLVLYMVLKRDVARLTEEVKKSKDLDIKGTIKTGSLDGDVVKLTKELNSIIEIKFDAVNKYKKVDKALKEMVSNISHDIRTPLTSLMGYIDLLSTDISEEEREKYIRILKSRSMAMEVLLEDFYDIARIDSGDYPIVLEKIKLSDIVTSRTLDYYEDFSKKDIQPIIDIEEGLEVVSDLNSINRIISNLIQNSIRYAKSEVKIILRREDNICKLIFLNDLMESIEVDTDKIFNRSYTGDVNRSVGGTGLGLAITKQLSETLGHKLYAVSSTENFSIILEFKAR